MSPQSIKHCTQFLSIFLFHLIKYQVNSIWLRLSYITMIHLLQGTNYSVSVYSEICVCWLLITLFYSFFFVFYKIKRNENYFVRGWCPNNYGGRSIILWFLACSDIIEDLFTVMEHSFKFAKIFNISNKIKIKEINQKDSLAGTF